MLGFGGLFSMAAINFFKNSHIPMCYSVVLHFLNDANKKYTMGTIFFFLEKSTPETVWKHCQLELVDSRIKHNVTKK